MPDHGPHPEPLQYLKSLAATMDPTDGFHVLDALERREQRMAGPCACVHNDGTRIMWAWLRSEHAPSGAVALHRPSGTLVVSIGGDGPRDVQPLRGSTWTAA